MAVRFLNYVVADLCLGKPPLRSLPASITVGEALTALKTFEENYISVWSCKDHNHQDGGDCVCIGKVCMVDIICFLANEENLSSPAEALSSPLSALLSPFPGLVRHVEPCSSLLDAIDLILQGTQNLVVPIKTSSRSKALQNCSTTSTTHHNGGEFCWLTQEDVIRFLLSSIGLFSPVSARSVESLGIISTDFMAIWYHSPASTAIGAISHSLAEQTSVGVVDNNGILVGEISPFTLAGCDESVAAAIATLSTGDLMAYIDCGGPPDDIVKVVKERLKERNYEGTLEEFEIFSSNISSSNSSSSEDDESSGSPITPLTRPGRYSKSRSYSARMVRRAEAIVCHPGSSLVAVMIQALAHRVNYVWVIEDDCRLVGIVTFTNMLEVFREHFHSMS
ncbi:Cystathionine beta-synthase, core [Heracleum sosnowskyi]|uniref:Cystathionine beta-synthase, core n=1 Tax=Heracleum sosnowskyi TaxID=360622 RepID=A0AAD8NDS0_9APIA|nr:Cystathionine beta-synthase, core [Heracleum sosnowskyi]